MILHFKMIIDNLLRKLFTKGKSSFLDKILTIPKNTSLSKNPVQSTSNSLPMAINLISNQLIFFITVNAYKIYYFAVERSIILIFKRFSFC